MNVVILLPTYNERENVLIVLNKLREAVRKIKKYTFSYLVIDDMSPDGTKDLVISYAKKQSDVFLILGEKEGLGKALLRGMRYAIDTLHADILVQIDVDLSHDPAVLPEFIKAFDTGANFVVGSRYISGGSIPDNWALYRKIYSIFGNAIVRFGLGFPEVHDWTGGYRAYTKYFVEQAKTELSRYQGYVFQIAFLHASILKGAKIREVPIHFSDRRFGHSKIAPSEYIRDIFLYIICQRKQALLRGSFMKFCAVGTIGFIINTVILEIFVFFEVHPVAGSVMGAECAIVSNFLFNNAWTFRDRRAYGLKKLKKFLQFNTTSIGALVIQGIAVGAGSYVFGVEWYRLYYLIGVSIGLIWNYTMYSKVIWKK